MSQQAQIGSPAKHFPTPSMADGLLLAPAANQVVAFTTTASSAGPLHAVGAGKCLNVPQLTSAPAPAGTQVQIWPCNGGTNQQWTLSTS